MKNNRYIALTAILAALITITTAYICHIPVPAHDSGHGSFSDRDLRLPGGNAYHHRSLLQGRLLHRG